mgnify:FL=1
MTKPNKTYQQMIRELLDDHEIQMERLALDVKISIPVLYRLKRGSVKEPRSQLARESILNYYARVSNQ